MVPNGVPWDPIWDPHGTPRGPNVLLVVNYIQLHPPYPKSGNKQAKQATYELLPPSLVILPHCAVEFSATAAHGKASHEVDSGWVEGSRIQIQWSFVLSLRCKYANDQNKCSWRVSGRATQAHSSQDKVQERLELGRNRPIIAPWKVIGALEKSNFLSYNNIL